MRAKTNNQSQSSIGRGGYTMEEFLSMLDGVVKKRGHWMARCPAHDDGRPSLRVREGDRGIRINCWAGCTFEEITYAMGISPSMMFYDALDEQQLAERRLIGLRRRLQELDTRIYFGQSALKNGMITDPEKQELRNWIAERIDVKREIDEAEKVSRL